MSLSNVSNMIETPSGNIRNSFGSNVAKRGKKRYIGIVVTTSEHHSQDLDELPETCNMNQPATGGGGNDWAG